MANAIKDGNLKKKRKNVDKQFKYKAISCT